MPDSHNQYFILPHSSPRTEVRVWRTLGIFSTSNASITALPNSNHIVRLGRPEEVSLGSDDRVNRFQWPPRGVSVEKGEDSTYSTHIIRSH